MKTELAKAPTKTAPTTTSGFVIPALIADAGEKAGKRFIEFLTATIRNANTRHAYARAIGEFFLWCERHRLTPTAIEPVHVAPYIEQLPQRPKPKKPLAAPSVKQHLAWIPIQKKKPNSVPGFSTIFRLKSPILRKFFGLSIHQFPLRHRSYPTSLIIS